MDFTLYVGDYAYSSWSLRGWLLLDAFGIPFTTRYAHMKTEEFEALRGEMAPSKLVPALSISDGTRAPVVVWDTFAMAETLHEYHPQAGIWPNGASARPTARSLVAEMHSGFTALRGACPMNMRRAYDGFDVSDEVRSDLERLSLIWAHARARKTADGPFLFGAFSAVDAFFAPVCSRIATYGLEMGETDLAYVAAVLGHDPVRRWRAMGMADRHLQAHYEF
ncbi:MAG: glutathione S-transferase, partial [Pseudomonadota bacterium]